MQQSFVEVQDEKALIWWFGHGILDVLNLSQYSIKVSLKYREILEIESLNNLSKLFCKNNV